LRWQAVAFPTNRIGQDGFQWRAGIRLIPGMSAPLQQSPVDLNPGEVRGTDSMLGNGGIVDLQHVAECEGSFPLRRPKDFADDHLLRVNAGRIQILRSKHRHQILHPQGGCYAKKCLDIWLSTRRSPSLLKL